MNKYTYVDIPSEDFFKSNSTFCKDPFFMRLLNQYKKIETTSSKSLESRSLMLLNILEFLKKKNENPELLAHITAKYNQLIALKKLFNKGTLRDIPELYNKEAVTEYFSTDPKCFNVSTKTMYDLHNNIIFGNSLLEVLDPSHRVNLTSYIEGWKKQNTNQNFFIWLENNCLYNIIPEVYYYNDEELEKCRLHLINNKITDNTLRPLTTNDKEFIFILDTNKNFYGTYSSKKIKHTSLSRGYPILSAGNIKVKDGELIEFNLESGHYLPTRQAVTNFLEFSALLPHKIGYYNNNKFIQHTLIKGQANEK